MLATLSESTEPSRWHTTSRHRQTHKQLAHVQHWYLHQWAAAVHNTKPMYCFNCSNRCLNSTWTPGRWNFTSVWLENILRTFFFPLTVIISLLNKQKRRRICVCVLDICSYSSKTPGLGIKMTKKEMLDVSFDGNLTMNFSSIDLKQCAQERLQNII